MSALSNAQNLIATVKNIFNRQEAQNVIQEDPMLLAAAAVAFIYSHGPLLAGFTVGVALTAVGSSAIESRWKPVAQSGLTVLKPIYDKPLGAVELVTALALLALNDHSALGMAFLLGLNIGTLAGHKIFNITT